MNSGTRSWSERYSQLVLTPDEAVARVHSGDMVYASGGIGQPLAVLSALSRRRDLRRVTLATADTLVPPDYLVRQYLAANQGEASDGGIRHTTLQVGPGDRDGVMSGVADFIPVDGTMTWTGFPSRHLDVLIVGSSGMDDEGNLNLSCSVDWLPELIAAAEQNETLLIVEVNRKLPWTEGHSTFRRESVDCIVESERDPIGLPAGPVLPEASAVGAFLASLVPDEATLHVGLGDLVAQACASLERKRDLGVHSDLLCDVFLHLHQRGALTCRRKGFLDGRWVGSRVLGSPSLLALVNRNPAVELHPIEFVAETANIQRNRRMVSVTQAALVDLMGQVAAQSGQWECHSNGGIQHTFHRAASRCPEGVGIVVLPSSHLDSTQSSVVPHMPLGTLVTIPAQDVDCVVTEHGVARLRGCTLRQRVLGLVAVAHPAHRDRLAFEARKLRLI
jgi:acyl-CoA hydrolase